MWRDIVIFMHEFSCISLPFCSAFINLLLFLLSCLYILLFCFFTEFAWFSLVLPPLPPFFFACVLDLIDFAIPLLLLLFFFLQLAQYRHCLTRTRFYCCLFSLLFFFHISLHNFAFLFPLSLIFPFTLFRSFFVSFFYTRTRSRHQSVTLPINLTRLSNLN